MICKYSNDLDLESGGWNSVKFIKIKGPREAWGLGIWQKIALVAGICQILQICPGVSYPGHQGMVTLGIDWYIKALQICIP